MNKRLNRLINYTIMCGIVMLIAATGQCFYYAMRIKLHVMSTADISSAFEVAAIFIFIGSLCTIFPLLIRRSNASISKDID